VLSRERPRLSRRLVLQRALDAAPHVRNRLRITRSNFHRPVPNPEPLGAAAREWLGEPSPEIVAAVNEKQRLIATPSESWPDTGVAWDAVRAKLAAALEAFPVIERALSHAGTPAEPGYLEVDEATLRATFRYATRLRARYMVIDFLEGQGALDARLEAMLA
jgi:hypothetical protein